MYPPILPLEFHRITLGLKYARVRHTMLLWTICVALGLLGILELVPTLLSVLEFWTQKKPEAELRRYLGELLGLQELLESGHAVPAQAWSSLGSCVRPWGPLTAAMLESLRERGASVLPIVRRLREAGGAELEFLHESRVGSSQAFAQAVLCLILAPTLGVVLWWTLESLRSVPELWVGSVGISILLGLLAARWMVQLAAAARRGNLSQKQAEVRLVAVLAIERMLAIVRSGVPVDLAWSQSLSSDGYEDLRGIWGASLWTTQQARGPLEELGLAVRKAVQVATMQGQSSVERLEALVRDFGLDQRSCVRRELALLSGRALKPLFLLVMPSVLGLLAVALVMEGLSVV